jgi:predicted O-linked N-acetylglucosamine transferase (SPINDLY family)
VLLRSSTASTLTFGSFNNLAKMSPATIALWAAALKAVPQSRLLIKSKALRDDSVRRSLTEKFAQAGLDPERLMVLPWEATTQGHLNVYGEVDIALDTVPYNGATTTCEALWMGVPVVTLIGRTHAGRMGASILRAAGLGCYVATTATEFVDICVRLANERSALIELREHGRERLRASALMDEAAFVRGFEAALRQMLASPAPHW